MKTCVRFDTIFLSTKLMECSSYQQASGDFAEVAYAEIAARSIVEKSKMTIDEVNASLDELSQSSKL